MQMRVNIAWAELHQGERFSSYGLIRRYQTQAEQLPAFLLFFGLQKWRNIRGTFLGSVGLTKTHISSHYFLQAAAQFFKLQMITNLTISKMFNFSRLYTGR
jgi:hypothetical protein